MGYNLTFTINLNALDIIESDENFSENLCDAIDDSTYRKPLPVDILSSNGEVIGQVIDFYHADDAHKIEINSDQSEAGIATAIFYMDAYYEIRNDKDIGARLKKAILHRQQVPMKDDPLLRQFRAVSGRSSSSAGIVVDVMLKGQNLELEVGGNTGSVIKKWPSLRLI
jgi:hypothetical protein